MILEQLRALEKTDKFKEAVAKKRKSQILGRSSGSGSSGGSGMPDDIQKFAQQLKETLEKRVSNIKSRRGNDFLNDIVVDTKAELEMINGKEYVTIGVSFNRSNRNTIVSRSLQPNRYPGAVYMPLIVNNKWKARRYTYGNYRGKRIRSALEWPYKNQKGFMYEVIKEFNDKTPDYVKAEMHVAYDGGTFGSGTLYKDINYL